MKSRPRRNMRSTQCVWFRESDFDDIAESALLRRGLLPCEPSPVDIDLFVEREFGFEVTYEAMPAGKLGRIVFSENGPCRLVINRSLDRPLERAVNRRCRASIAHECGHGLVHKEKYRQRWKAFRTWIAAGRDPEDFAATITGSAGEERAEEFQAFRLMASLLVPRRLLQKAIAATALAEIPPWRWTRGDIAVLTYHVSEIFDVSRELAERRIRSFFKVPQSCRLLAAA